MTHVWCRFGFANLISFFFLRLSTINIDLQLLQEHSPSIEQIVVCDLLMAFTHPPFEVLPRLLDKASLCKPVTKPMALKLIEKCNTRNGLCDAVDTLQVFGVPIDLS